VGYSLEQARYYKVTTLSLSPFVRYYFGEPDPYQIFVEGGAGFIFQGVEGDFGKPGFRYHFGPGVAIFISDYASLDLQLLYNKIGGEFDSTQLGIYFGMQLYLNKGSKE